MKRTSTLPTCLVAALLGLGLMAAGQAAHARQVRPPDVPVNLEVDQGNSAFLVGHAVGTQNYVCLPAGAGFAYALFTPQATLFDDHNRQVITHFFSPNLAPTDSYEIAGTIRAAWQHSDDTSTVWGKVIDSASNASDPDFVAADAIAWLKVAVVGIQDGPQAGDALSGTTFIQRVNTSGGVPPTNCTSPADVGRRAFVPYTADYFFYSADDVD